MENKNYIQLEQHLTSLEQKFSKLQNSTPEQRAQLFNMQTTVFDWSNYGIDFAIDLNNLSQENVLIETFDLDNDGIKDEKRYTYHVSENETINFNVSINENGEHIGFKNIRKSTIENGEITTIKFVDQDENGVLDWVSAFFQSEKDKSKTMCNYQVCFNSDYHGIGQYNAEYKNKKDEIYIQKGDYDFDGTINSNHIYSTIYDENGNFVSKNTSFHKDEDSINTSEAIGYYDKNNNVKLQIKKEDTNYDGNFDKIKQTKYLNNGITKETITNDEDYDGVYEIEADVFRNKDNEIIDIKTINFPEVDGEIGNSKQNAIGDCWLLSGLNALSNTPYGSEIIKNSITINNDNSYSVYFKGIDKSYTVTQDEIIAAKLKNIYSTGDIDMLLMELAFEKVFSEGTSLDTGYSTLNSDIWNTGAQDKKEDHVLDGGYSDYVTYLLAGKHVTGVRGENVHNIDPKTTPSFVSFDANLIPDINGKQLDLSDTGKLHACSVKSIENDIVTIVNPWDSSKEEKIYIDDFADNFHSFSILQTEPEESETKTNSTNFLEKFKNTIFDNFYAAFNMIFS